MSGIPGSDRGVRTCVCVHDRNLCLKAADCFTCQASHLRQSPLTIIGYYRPCGILWGLHSSSLSLLNPRDAEMG